MLFIGSLPSKKIHFNGETNKTGDIFKLFKKTNALKITKIDLTHFKLLRTIKMIICSILFKYDSVFVSKCVIGGCLAIHLIKKFGRKSNKENICFYWIGNGIHGFEDKKIYLSDLHICKYLIFESQEVYEDFKHLNFANYVIVPCVKPSYELSYTEKNYNGVKTLKCIYFSRIAEQKGLMDAIIAVEKANELLGKKAFTLDIAGAPTSDEACVFEQKVLEHIKDKPEFTYFGRTFCVTGIETYERLQQYDLHLFPSHFKQECVPGSIVDMFIAGIPTLSSSFPNVKNLLSSEDSYIFEQENIKDFVEKLVYVYKHKDELNLKRRKSFALRIKYDENHFLEVCKNTMNLF